MEKRVKPICKSTINSSDRTITRFMTHFDKGKSILVKAVDLDEKARDDGASRVQACDSYKKALTEFKKACEVTTNNLNPAQRTALADNMKKMDGYLKGAQDRFETLLQQIENDNRIFTRGIPPIQRGPCHEVKHIVNPDLKNMKYRQQFTMPMANSRAELLKGVDSQLGNKLLDEILEETGVTLNDITGCDQAKAALEEAVVFPCLNPDLFQGLRQPVKGILLFGPPGNGKTMLAKALAGESKQVFFNISASSLTSKFVGEGEKAVRALFRLAKNAQPCIVFIDEIDSLLCQRNENELESSRRLKTEFLIQFDGAASRPDDRFVIIGATNRPHELDDAVLRRFPKRILLNLPDDAERFALIKCILKKYNLTKGLNDNDIRYIASRTSGYSYSDLTAVCKEAAMVPVRDISRDKLAGTAADTVRSLKRSDFDKALSIVRPSVNERQVEVLQRFARTTAQV